MLEKQIGQVLQSYKAAAHGKDVDAFIKLYDEAVCIFDAWGTWSYEGAAAWRPIVEQWFSSLGDERVAVSVEDVRIAGGNDFASVSAIVTYAGISQAGEKLRSLQNRLSWVLNRKQGSWKIIHEHTSAPIGFHDYKAILHRDGVRPAR